MRAWKHRCPRRETLLLRGPCHVVISSASHFYGTVAAWVQSAATLDAFGLVAGNSLVGVPAEVLKKDDNLLKFIQAGEYEAHAPPVSQGDS